MGEEKKKKCATISSFWKSLFDSQVGRGRGEEELDSKKGISMGKRKKNL